MARKIGATKAEKNYRLNALVRLSDQGLDPQRLQDYAVREWGLSAPWARKLVAEMFELLFTTWDQVTVDQLVARQLSRLDYLYSRAVARGEIAVAAQVACKVLDFFGAMQAAQEKQPPPPVSTPVDPEAPAVDPEEDF